MKLHVISFIFCLSISMISLAQKIDIQWLSFEQLTDAFEENQKPILVFLYTDWCKYCKMQQSTTFQDSSIIEAINQEYYAIRLNAESKIPVSFFGREYKFDAESGFHELATYLGSNEGKLKLPTTLILDQRLTPTFRKSALLTAEEMKLLLR